MFRSAIVVVSCGAYSAYTASKRRRCSISQLQTGEAFEPFVELLSNFCGMPHHRSVSYAQAHEIINSFEPSKFLPAKGFFGLEANRHYQSIVGSGALNKFGIGPPIRRNFETVVERFDTPDGDWFEVEFSKDHFGSEEALLQHKETPVVVIFHGLESGAKGELVSKMANAYLEQGFSVVLMNFRSCSGQPNDKPGAYHVGFTMDGHQITEMLKQRYPHRKIYISGFSLGGNVSLKLLGELGATARDRNIYGCVTMCVPFNAVGSGQSIDSGINKYLYSAYFVQRLKAKAERQFERFEGNVPFDIGKIRQCSTVGDFDDAYIAPLYGFKDKYDYYRTQGALRWLKKIRVPSICINAKDDPFIPADTLPDPEEDVEGAPVRLLYTDHGGHCGYLSQGDGQTNDDMWIAREMARAMVHIHKSSEPFK